MTEFSHGTTEHNDRTDLGDDGFDRTNTKPFTEINPIRITVLYGCGRKNPSTERGMRNGDHVNPSSSILTITNSMSLIEDNTLKCILNESLAIDRGTGIGGEKATGHMQLSSTRWRPGTGTKESGNGPSTFTELLGPASNECGRTDNECLECLRRVPHETNELKGLTESHVIGENATTAYRSIKGLTFEHPANALDLMGKIFDSLTGRKESRHDNREV